MTAFAVAPEIAAESKPIAAMPLSELLAKTTAAYPWVILVPRRSVFEIADLDAPDRAALMEEIAEASRALRAATACDKINIASLGNLVRQLHVHIIARSPGDANWPDPVWAGPPRAALAPDAVDRLVAAMRAELRL